MRKLFFGVLSVAMLMAFTLPALAADCSGNACNDVVISFSNGCYTVTNHSTRRVKVDMGNFGLTLQRGETKSLIWGDKCIQSYIGETRANYE